MKTIPLLVYQKGTEYRALARSTTLEVCKRYPKLKIAIKPKTSVPVKENIRQYYQRYTTSVIRQLKQRQRKGQKSNGLRLAIQQLCTCITLFWYISLQSLHDYHVILTKLGSLRNDDDDDDGGGDGNENGKKAIGLISKKTTTLHVHHAFLYISLPSLHDYNVKVVKFTFCLGREHKTTTFFLFS